MPNPVSRSKKCIRLVSTASVMGWPSRAPVRGLSWATKAERDCCARACSVSSPSFPETSAASSFVSSVRTLGASREKWTRTSDPRASTRSMPAVTRRSSGVPGLRAASSKSSGRIPRTTDFPS